VDIRTKKSLFYAITRRTQQKYLFQNWLLILIRKGREFINKDIATALIIKTSVNTMNKEKTILYLKCSYCSRTVQEKIFNKKYDYDEIIKKHGWHKTINGTLCPECGSRVPEWEKIF
jgi:hypothetical protein